MTSPEGSIDNRAGNTQRELEVWLFAHPDDETLQETASFINDLVSEWRMGRLTEEEVLQALVARYHETDGVVSEESSAVLNQATMWFGYEAGVSEELDEEILQELHNN